MRNKIDPRKLKWIYQPKLFVQDEDKLVLETEPFTDLRPAGRGAEAIELSILPQGSFCFSARVDFDFKNTFDQCGLMLYLGENRKAIIGTEYKDPEIMKLSCIVYHNKIGDRSIRDLSANIHSMDYRIWYRGGALRIQYSFSGGRYSDLREFWIDPGKGKMSIGMYACSPANSWFDCTFSNMYLEEED